MISEEYARQEAFDFFHSENLPKLSEMIVKGACLDKIFPKAVRSLGKKRILALYRKLPSELKRYFLVNFIPGSERLSRKLEKIDVIYCVSRDPALNSKYLQLIEQVLIEYLGK